MSSGSDSSGLALVCASQDCCSWGCERTCAWGAEETERFYPLLPLKVVKNRGWPDTGVHFFPGYGLA